MRKRLLILLVSILIFAGCKKEVESKLYTIKVTDVSNGCAPVITFLDNIDEVKQLLGTNSNLFMTRNLPKGISTGDQFLVTIRKPKLSDDFACVDLWIRFPLVVITSVN